MYINVATARSFLSDSYAFTMDGAPQDPTMTEALATAALYGNKEMLESLLDGGVDPNTPNSSGNCPLHEAAQYGETECASLLLAHKGE